MTDHIKTTTTVYGLQQIDEFDALCALLGRRRHELASDMVLEGIHRYRADPTTSEAVQSLLRNARSYRREQAGTMLHIVKNT